MSNEEILQEEKRFDEWYASQREIFAKFESPAKNIAWSAWQAAQQSVHLTLLPPSGKVIKCPECHHLFTLHIASSQSR